MTDLSRSNGRDGDYYKSLGGLEAMMESHEKRLDSIDEKLETLIKMSERVKGSWKVLACIAFVAASIGAGSSRFLEAIKQLFLG